MKKVRNVSKLAYNNFGHMRKVLSHIHFNTSYHAYKDMKIVRQNHIILLLEKLDINTMVEESERLIGVKPCSEGGLGVRK